MPSLAAVEMRWRATVLAIVAAAGHRRGGRHTVDSLHATGRRGDWFQSPNLVNDPLGLASLPTRAVFEQMLSCSDEPLRPQRGRLHL